MSEEEISKAPAQDVTSTDNNNEEPGSENIEPRVFDITPDLNIAPAKDDADSANPVTIPNNIVQNIELPDMVVSPKNSAVPAQVQLTPDQNVPQSNFTNAVSGFSNDTTTNGLTTPATTQFGPANPPTKTVGTNRTSFNSAPIEPNKIAEASNLQDAVSSIKFNPTKKENVPAPTIPDRPWEAKKDAKIKPLRTYETDFAEAMARKRITTTSAIIAETKDQNKKLKPKQKKLFKKKSFKETTIDKPLMPIINKPNFSNYNQKEDILKNAKPPEDPKPIKETHSFKNWLLFIISFILVVGGLYAGYYLYKHSAIALIFKPKTTPNIQVPQIIETNSLLQPDSKISIDIDSKNQSGIINAVKSEMAKPDKENSIKEIVLTKTTDNIVKKVEAKDMLNILKVPVPELMSRSLSPEWMLGIYTGTGDQKHAFIITTNNFFQNTFAGIIQWKKICPRFETVHIFEFPDKFHYKRTI